MRAYDASYYLNKACRDIDKQHHKLTALLEALKLIRDTHETSAGYMRTIAEAAIMKAEGRS